MTVKYYDMTTITCQNKKIIEFMSDVCFMMTKTEKGKQVTAKKSKKDLFLKLKYSNLEFISKLKFTVFSYGKMHRNPKHPA